MGEVREACCTWPGLISSANGTKDMGETSRRLLLCTRSHPSLFFRNVVLWPYTVSRPGHASMLGGTPPCGTIQSGTYKEGFLKADLEFHTWPEYIPYFLSSQIRPDLVLSSLTLPLLQSEAAQSRLELRLLFLQIFPFSFPHSICK